MNSAPGGPGAGFRPTHVVPGDGLPAWEAPDATRPTAPLDAFLPVRLLTRRGEWAEILCSNGWSAWVDGRLLVAVPQPPPTAGRPLGPAEDPAPLLDRTADALERVRRAAADLAAGRVDPEGFRRATLGLRAGIVLDGDRLWVYDDTAGRWMYTDGGRLTTYAADAGPGAPPAPEPRPPGPDPGAGADVPEVPHEATRVAGPPDGGGP
ncbi:hypothetical protein ABZZ17_00750 [Streptomyces sp. NPDC006512]|uniref:hypothetical protein n=1 Tax=Streptomyces sp. NPDC006512 TaxID=3154307 RepID=UPI0033B62709